MARRVFYSFHYRPDNWRASQVRNIGVIDGNQPASDNDWEKVTKGGDKAIQKWIDDQMSGRSCVVVLIGSNTANRKWINYEIKKAWRAGKALVGIYINKLKDRNGHQSSKGSNPFSNFTVNGVSMAKYVKCHTPKGITSTAVYQDISDNLEDWIEDALKNKRN